VSDAVRHKLGEIESMLRAGSLEQAQRACEALLDQHPGLVGGWVMLSHALGAQGRAADADHAARRAVQSIGADAGALVSLGDALREARRLEPAVEAYERARALAPARAEILGRLGAMHFRLRRYERAESCYRQAASIDPRDARIHGLHAEVLERLNRLDDARDAAKRAIDIDPDHPSANLALARLDRRQGDASASCRRLERLIELGRVRDHVLASAWVELGHARDAAGLSSQAFDAYAMGQRTWSETPRAREVPRDAYPEMLRRYDRWLTECPPGVWKHDPDPDPGPEADLPPSPVFFVGFPRSGTTLVEQMLRGHDGLCPVDEPRFVTRMIGRAMRMLPDSPGYPWGIESLDEGQIRELESGYHADAEAHLAPERLDGRILVDKLPLNICHLPLIRRVFPRSKVIVALRDPRDCCLSCFFQEFAANEAMVQFYEFGSTVSLYAQVMGLWLRYRHELGLDWLEYRYEDLVADPQAIAQRIIGFLGVPWQDAVLDFADRSRGRSISTPSYQAVTRGIDARAIARWKRYEERIDDELEPLEAFIDAFGYDAPPASEPER